MIAVQGEVIEELTAANARLVERVSALERAAGRNSGNSSMPPSTDDLPGRKKPSPRRAKGSGRERGKQRGAPGSSLPWVAQPDEHVAYRPHGGCACGADLAQAVAVGIERSHQVHDLPKIRIVVRQHDVYRVRCTCGREHVATLPEEVSRAPSSYGELCRHRHNSPWGYSSDRTIPRQRFAMVGRLSGGPWLAGSPVCRAGSVASSWAEG